MQNANLVLLSENSSDSFFPQIKDYVDGILVKPKLLPSEQVIFKKEIGVNAELKIPILYNCDVIYGFELIGECDYVQENIESIELIIGDRVICVFYLSECYFMENDGKFSIKLDLNRVFLDYTFLPVIGIKFNNIYLKIKGCDLYNLKCYVVQGLLEYKLRVKCLEMNHEILMNHYERYELKMNGRRIYMNYGETLLSVSNFIKSLKFQFSNNTNFNTITIYGNDNPLTILTQSDLLMFNNKELIIDDFHYKLFLYNKIIIEFDNDIKDNSIVLTTTNYNLLNISGGICGLRYSGLRRNIWCEIKSEYVELDEEIYREKVLPKEDKICAISHEEFDEMEEKIICGNCYASYKKNVIEEWFGKINEKICPYGRCHPIWYIYNLSKSNKIGPYSV